MKIPLTRRVRKDPLGHVSLNMLRVYVGGVLNGLNAIEHDDNGFHNALEIPRTVGRVIYSAGYTTGTFNLRMSSVSSAATGVVTATVGSGELTSPYILASASPLTAGDNRPCLATCEVVSDTDVTVRLRKLTSALGAGNTWAAYDGSFALALHGSPFLHTSAMRGMSQFYRRKALTDSVSGWNAIVENLGTSRALALAEHTTAGEHDAVEVCRDVGHLSWDGVKYNIDPDGGTFTNVATISTGVSEVTCSYTFASTASMQVFITPTPSSSTSFWVINPDPVSTTKFRTYCFQYDFSAHTWALADGDFHAFVYGA